jgi:hypothetical protein
MMLNGLVAVGLAKLWVGRSVMCLSMIDLF